MPNAAKRPFLTAEWRNLLMLNYEIEPAVLQPYLPAGTELDLWEGCALVSMVGFQFRRTRILGLPPPFHTRFLEVNLRFYVRRPGSDMHRGVVFIKEIVPLPAVARLARILYGENYVAMPMGCTLEEQGGQVRPDGLVEYTWKLPRRSRGAYATRGQRLQRMGGLAQGEYEPLAPGSEAEFIAEHYYGYTAQRGKRRTGVYRVEHPRWRARPVAQPYLLCDVAALYGPEFAPYLRRPPRSAFLAEGSPVAVYPGGRLNQ